jgi:hypothetical protein
MAKRTKWLRGLLRTKKQREAAEAVKAAKAAKDWEAYEKGYPDRSR